MKSKKSFSKILKSSGFKKIELSHVIPSIKALKRSGDIRRNMFSYYDQNFQEISLRPDLSLSAALRFASEKTSLKKKYFYSGLAYRKPTKKKEQPIISQFGWEIFNSKDKHKDDKEIIITSLKILKNTKFKKCKLKIGNLEIFVSLINHLPNLSSRYKERLIRHYFRKDYFNKLLKKLETNYDIDEKKVINDKLLASKLRKLDQEEIYGGRSLRSILERFDNKMRSPRDELSKKDVKIIKNFLKIECDISNASKNLNNFFKKNKINLVISDDYFPINKDNHNNLKILYASDLGRNVSYYTNMVFNIEVSLKSKSKPKIYISGGRYSNLLKNLGYKKIEAVGAAVNLNI